ncbi:hypothetical protein C8R44DRAFT_846789 [Mycena epipterygia]|nr:hypothetical protein C8R44DRAFT_846789 [Mycena epipterygia]
MTDLPTCFQPTHLDLHALLPSAAARPTLRRPLLALSSSTPPHLPSLARVSTRPPAKQWMKIFQSYSKLPITLYSAAGPSTLVAFPLFHPRCPLCYGFRPKHNVSTPPMASFEGVSDETARVSAVQGHLSTVALSPASTPVHPHPAGLGARLITYGGALKQTIAPAASGHVRDPAGARRTRALLPLPVPVPHAPHENPPLAACTAWDCLPALRASYSIVQSGIRQSAPTAIHAAFSHTGSFSARGVASTTRLCLGTRSHNSRRCWTTLRSPYTPPLRASPLRHALHGPTRAERLIYLPSLPY